MHTTKVFSDLLEAYVDPTINVIALKGSARSSKTTSTLQLLDIIGQRTKKDLLTSVVSETMPHLKRGAIRDFKNILGRDNRFNQNAWHDTDKIYSYDKGKIEFFSADQPSKVLGPARDILYMNEAINMQYEIYRQLAIRTTGKIILDYNPAFEFWVDSKLAPRPDVKIIHSTYLDNDFLSASQIAEIESSRDTDPEWFNVYGLGLTGSKEGLVIKNWDIVQELPTRNLWKSAYIGIDFGGSAPTAATLVVEALGDIWLHQVAYERNMDNGPLADAIKDGGWQDIECICDAADPFRIRDLRALGINAVKSDNKEIEFGITIFNRWKKHYTASSLDTINENRQYRYPKNELGEYGTVPIKAHGHAKDAERYVFLNRLSHVASGFDITIGSTRKQK